MVVFIDESGIHKQTGHSTTAVVYVEVRNLEKFEKAFIDIEKDLRITSFHWADERWFNKLKKEKKLYGQFIFEKQEA